MFEVSHNSSHARAQPSTPLVDCLVNDILLQSADQTMQQSGATSDQQCRVKRTNGRHFEHLLW